MTTSDQNRNEDLGRAMYGEALPDGIYEVNRFDAWLTEYTRVKQAEALEEAASSPIPREALTSGTRAWLRARAAEYRKGESDDQPA